MRAAKQPIGRLLAVERTSVREGTDDAPQQQKLEHEAGHLDQGRGGLSGTGYSGFARLNATSIWPAAEKLVASLFFWGRGSST